MCFISYKLLDLNLTINIYMYIGMGHDSRKKHWESPSFEVYPEFFFNKNYVLIADIGVQFKNATIGLLFL